MTGEHAVAIDRLRCTVRTLPTAFLRTPPHMNSKSVVSGCTRGFVRRNGDLDESISLLANRSVEEFAYHIEMPDVPRVLLQ